ncbi:LuxR C-terminal-related transcriptional regulator [Pseudohalioglobus lutimaris]|uniref:LuxR family transcriptional regulator n=1 Tax=Pseudohalioglobus lutimaris TaxID=1737061 RepID=A0A2N5WX57_9GAMM|nr:LuxR C-terminal-related transcriptional regulator [Pseudohalioglobus lutimaris]PLW66821.1 LuxR family transcriptional regulator [Pseudohalioglobus lutimaris]
MPDLSILSKHIAALIPAAGHTGFPQKLVAMLRELVPVDDASIIFYSETALPVVEYFEVQQETGSSTLDTFVKGAFLLDPYYLSATRDGEFGVFRLRDLSPSGFKDSEYYKTWYRNCGYQDECGFVIPTAEQGFINIALGKTAARATFSKRERRLLQDIYPAVEALCQQHWAQARASEDGVNLRAKLHNALESFGSSLLTERETQVINLVLHGHSTKTVADKLSISMETVKLHRKHAYAKLEVSSQAELFYLFLDSLMSAQDYETGDTLVAYMQPPPKAKS